MQRQHQIYEAAPPALDMLQAYHTMLASREADRRESILFRQGMGKFQLPSAGHEAMAAVAAALRADDPAYCYYRDRAFLLARGTPLDTIALDYFGKKHSSSGGRQMASHFFAPDQHVMSCASPTGMQCLPAVGHAWGITIRGESKVVLCCIGDAATRQGEFYEAVAFATQKQLPVLFVIEDNKYGISTCTKGNTPLDMGLLNQAMTTEVMGWEVQEVFEQAQQLAEECRQGKGPRILWMHCARLMSHTSADDQRMYRSAEDLESCAAHCDPIQALEKRLLERGMLTPPRIASLKERAANEVRQMYDWAVTAEDPTIASVSAHLLGQTHTPTYPALAPDKECWTMAEAINHTLGQLLAARDDVVIFGEDIEDPKGGVFGLTRGMSSQFPHRVFNSPLAEATIAGTASGLALSGLFPIIELQFIDFVGPAFNQLVNQIATLRWRTDNKQQCPMIIMAPYGGYVAGGGPWHTQSNEAWFGHVPGLKVIIPSSPQDAASQLLTAAYGEDPVLLLLPKRQFFRKVKIESAPVIPLYAEQPIITRPGKDITLLTWGNGVELSELAADQVAARGITVELIDLRAIRFSEMEEVRKSIIKTGRFMVVQEDSESCSLGQALISHCIVDARVWAALTAHPHLLSRQDGWVPFHNETAEALMPQVHSIVQAITQTVGK